MQCCVNPNSTVIQHCLVLDSVVIQCCLVATSTVQPVARCGTPSSPSSTGQQGALVSVHQGISITLLTRLLHPQHLDGIWTGQHPYNLNIQNLGSEKFQEGGMGEMV